MWKRGLKKGRIGCPNNHFLANIMIKKSNYHRFEILSYLFIYIYIYILKRSFFHQNVYRKLKIIQHTCMKKVRFLVESC